jgi:SAM-dependent methyltransferase
VFERIGVISKIGSCERILDLGCGDGIYTPYLKVLASEVIGLDLEPARLENTKKLAQVVRADAVHLPFSEKSFDAIWASEIIEHTPSFDIFQELERVARRKIVATMPHPSGPYFRRDLSHILKYDLHSLREFLQQRNWNYSVNGLGLCLPFRLFPNLLRKLFMQISWNHPNLSFNFLVAGVSPSGQIIGSVVNGVYREEPEKEHETGQYVQPKDNLAPCR